MSIDTITFSLYCAFGMCLIFEQSYFYPLDGNLWLDQHTVISYLKFGTFFVSDHLEVFKKICILLFSVSHYKHIHAFYRKFGHFRRVERNKSPRMPLFHRQSLFNIGLCFFQPCGFIGVFLLLFLFYLPVMMRDLQLCIHFFPLNNVT